MSDADRTTGACAGRLPSFRVADDSLLRRPVTDNAVWGQFPACKQLAGNRGVALMNRQRCKIKSRCTFRQPSRSRQKSNRPSPASSSLLGRTWCGFATRSVRIGTVSGLSFSASCSPMMLPGTACGTLRRASFGDWLNTWTIRAQGAPPRDRPMMKTAGRLSRGIRPAAINLSEYAASVLRRRFEQRLSKATLFRRRPVRLATPARSFGNRHGRCSSLRSHRPFQPVRRPS